MGANFYINYRKKKENNIKGTTKEERANILHNVICPRCGYQNHLHYAKKYGKCNLCGTTIDKGYFKKEMMKRLKEVNNG